MGINATGYNSYSISNNLQTSLASTDPRTEAAALIQNFFDIVATMKRDVLSGNFNNIHSQEADLQNVAQKIRGLIPGYVPAYSDSFSFNPFPRYEANSPFSAKEQDTLYGLTMTSNKIAQASGQNSLTLSFNIGQAFQGSEQTLIFLTTGIAKGNRNPDTAQFIAFLSGKISNLAAYKLNGDKNSQGFTDPATFEGQVAAVKNYGSQIDAALQSYPAEFTPDQAKALQEISATIHSLPSSPDDYSNSVMESLGELGQQVGFYQMSTNP